MSKIIAIANQKGGVAKTTTAASVADALGRAGKRVLLIDLDPQYSLSDVLGIDVATIERGTYELLKDPDITLSDVAVSSGLAGVDLVPTDNRLALAEAELLSEIGREQILGEALSGHGYDYVLIDCPPNIGLLTVNALAAAGHILIPVTADYMALNGVKLIFRSMERLRRLKRKAKTSLVITQYDGRTTHAREVASFVRKTYGKAVHSVQIPASVVVKDAAFSGGSVVSYRPRSKPAQAYKMLAEQLMKGRTDG